MKKWLLFSILVLTINMAFAGDVNTYKVLKVVDGDTVYIDFNDDGAVQAREKVRLNGIDAFEVKLTPKIDKQMEFYDLSEREALGLGYLGKEYAKQELLGKYVEAKYSAEVINDKYNRKLISIYYYGKNYEEEILKAGYATVYSKSNLAEDLIKHQNLELIRINAEKAENLNLAILNQRSNKYHKPYCSYGIISADYELVNIKKINFKYKKAGCCFTK